MHWTALDMRQYGCTHQALTFTNTLRAQTKQERSTQLRNGRILRSVTVSKFQQMVLRRIGTETARMVLNASSSVAGGTIQCDLVEHDILPYR
jgi:hypothetical protein